MRERGSPSSADQVSILKVNEIMDENGELPDPALQSFALDLGTALARSLA